MVTVHDIDPFDPRSMFDPHGALIQVGEEAYEVTFHTEEDLYVEITAVRMTDENGDVVLGPVDWGVLCTLEDTIRYEAEGMLAEAEWWDAH